MTKKRSQKIIEKLIHKYGNIDTELSSNNIYELSIAVVLSAQTTDRQVNSVTPDLFKRYPNFQRLSKAAISDVEDIIRSVGLYKTKARNIVKLSQEVMNVYNGILPNSREELMKLPGIGRKSANVILAIGFKKSAFPVDTHIKRLASRIGYNKSKNILEIEKSLTNFIPKEDWTKAHLLFITHGRNICRARKPQCLECPVSNLCDQDGVADNIS